MIYSQYNVVHGVLTYPFLVQARGAQMILLGHRLDLSPPHWRLSAVPFSVWLPYQKEVNTYIYNMLALFWIHVFLLSSFELIIIMQHVNSTLLCKWKDCLCKQDIPAPWARFIKALMTLIAIFQRSPLLTIRVRTVRVRHYSLWFTDTINYHEVSTAKLCADIIMVIHNL